MGNITGGSVSYGRTMKTGDFENKRVDVTLDFRVEDGEAHNTIFQAAAKEAHTKAHAMLGIKPAAAQEAAIAKTETVVEPKADKAAAAAAMNKKEATETAKPDGRSKEAKAAKAKAKGEPVKTEGEDIGEEFDETSEASAPEITDADLQKANGDKVKVLAVKHGNGASKVIRELIATFVEPPKKSTDLPQNVRAEYLKKLAALE